MEANLERKGGMSFRKQDCRICLIILGHFRDIMLLGCDGGLSSGWDNQECFSFPGLTF